MRVGSVFSGVGLLDCGLTLAGFEHAWLCEIDEFRRGILALRYPGVSIYPDVRQIGGALPPLSESEFLDAIALYESGLSLEAIAERFPITRQGLWERMKRTGIALRPQERHGGDNHFYRGGSVGADWAHNKVEKAILRGDLIRPDTCEKCGGRGQAYKDGRSAIQAHHDDYNEPLKVRWLCQPCHFDWHKTNEAVELRSPPTEGGDAQGALFDLAPVDVIAGGFP